MNIWLVNPFDPLPGDPEQEGRYAALVRLLLARGHRVTWWTSSFSHRFKKPVNQDEITSACRDINLDVVFLPAPPYHRNVGLARLRNHRALARRFGNLAQRRQPRPDVIVASSPPPVLAARAARVAKDLDAKFVVDIQDLWPQTFYRLCPAPLLPLARMILAPIARDAKSSCTAAHAIVGVADAYVDHGVELAKTRKITATFPLGIDLATFDSAAEAGRCEQYTKPTGETWLVYSGSLNRSYDCLTLLRAFAAIEKDSNPPLRLFITGRGELQNDAERIVRQNNLKKVCLTGFMRFEQWAYLLSQCDIGFNASFPEAMIYLPNKVFYYFAAGLAVLNTIPGQCSRIISQAAAGMDYTAGEVEQARAAIERYTTDSSRLSAAQHASRLVAQEQYDRGIIMPRYAELLEELT